MSKPLRLDSQLLYNLLVAFDYDPDPREHDDLDRPALNKLLRLGYLRPSRFGGKENVFGRHAVTAYVVTPEGRDFINRVEDADAVRLGAVS